jgi:hypothetical protein
MPTQQNLNYLGRSQFWLHTMESFFGDDETPQAIHMGMSEEWSVQFRHGGEMCSGFLSLGSSKLEIQTTGSAPLIIAVQSIEGNWLFLQFSLWPFLRPMHCVFVVASDSSCSTQEVYE